MGSAPEALLPEGVGGGDVCQTASGAVAEAPSATVQSRHSSRQGMEVPHSLLWQQQPWLDAS